MKIALLGDVHGNAVALQAVLDAAARESVERLLITGDLVGYYFAPRAVIELLEPWEKHIVRGNHEDMLCATRKDSMQLSSIEAKYGSGLRVALEELSTAQLDLLCDLPHPLDVEVEGRQIQLCHGAPWDNDTYVYPDAAIDVLTRCAASGADVVVLGHTHYPMVREVDGALIVNPGSVGQPRNREPGAQWALYDSVTNEIDLRREPYDRRPLIAEARRRHPEIPYLAAVLERT